MNDDISVLQDRILQLEQQVAALLHAQTEPRVILADAVSGTVVQVVSAPNNTALQFVNAQGNIALSIRIDGRDSDDLSMHNAHRRSCVALDVERYGGRLELKDSHFGSPGAVIAHGNDCDNDGGWLKPLNGDGNEVLTLPAEVG